MTNDQQRVLGRVLAVEEMNTIAGGTSPLSDGTLPVSDTSRAADSAPVADSAPGTPGDLSIPITDTGPTGGS